MKSYYGRRVRVYESRGFGQLVDTGKTGHLLEIDVENEHVMIEDDDGNIVKLFYKLVKFIYGGTS